MKEDVLDSAWTSWVTFLLENANVYTFPLHAEPFDYGVRCLFFIPSPRNLLTAFFQKLWNEDIDVAVMSYDGFLCVCIVFSGCFNGSWKAIHMHRGKSVIDPYLIQVILLRHRGGSSVTCRL